MSGTLRRRGVIEGFYGPPYSFAQRRELLQFLATAGLNTYVYAPKEDPYHRAQWREPYPPEYLDHFHDLVTLGSEIGVTFMFALSPALTFDPTTDSEVLWAKLLSVFSQGVRDFVLLFDDIDPEQPGADPNVQTDLVIETRDYLRSLDPSTTLAFISNYYAGTTEQLASDGSAFRRLFRIPSSQHYEAYARIPSDVPILWTGPAVFSERLTFDEAERFHSFTGRPVMVWDNYPVNDALVANELFLGPYVGREAALGNELEGILLNPMLQAEATKIPLWTFGRYCADGERYDPWGAWEEALGIASGGRGTRPLRTLARQFLSHPFIGDQEESPELAAATAMFWESRSADSTSALRDVFTRFAHTAEELDGELENRLLAEELREAAVKLSLLGEAGLVALDLLSQQEHSATVDLDQLQVLLEAAAKTPWLVGANTPVARGLAALVAERDPKRADVFADFFVRVLAELRATQA